MPKLEEIKSNHFNWWQRGVSLLNPEEITQPWKSSEKPLYTFLFWSVRFSNRVGLAGNAHQMTIVLKLSYLDNFLQ